MEKPIVLITGATAGIGAATARLLASLQYPLIICGRRKERLAQLENELKDKTNIFTLNFDVRHRDEVVKAIDSIPLEWKNIGVLINNAGNAHGLDPIQTGNIDDWDAMMDGNVKGMLYVSKPIINMMIANNQGGHIINIGSIAGKEVYANGNVYCASKFAVDALTKGMRLDLNPYGIKVTGIHPGMVETEFSVVRFKGDETKAAQVYKGFQPLKAEDIAETIRYVMEAPTHIQLADITILPTAQASATTVKRTI
ncbi:MAG: SDR family NAD(P)-dependent oxidoreductase [Cyclobacteriaceae bacterium]|jgi:3-hydroxy acid dehydrogenase/malonic semialdehyde reductase|nr:SDR family NAD(P)-dependent oxidoreductase [Cyclobacteriaceae bacterium]